MKSTHRVKSKKGRWAVLGTDGLLGDEGWIPEAMCVIWAEVAAKGAFPSCARAVEVCLRLGFSSEKHYLPMPLTPAQTKKVDLFMSVQDVPERKAPKMARFLISHSKSEAELLWVQHLNGTRKIAEARETHKILMRWVAAPSLRWSLTPGGASLLEASKATSVVELGRLAVELSELIPKAKAECTAAGQPIPEWMRPRLARLKFGVRELALAMPEAFAAEREFEAKTAVAVYAQGDRGRGFLDRQGKLKLDLAEACLFPNKKAALAFAKSRSWCGARSMKAVGVLASAVSCEHLLGVDEACDDLDAVIASREMKEIEKALSDAKIEQLEAELLRRRAEVGSVPASPAPPKSNRL